MANAKQKIAKCRLCKENKAKNSLWVKKFKYWNLHVCWYQHTLGTLGIVLGRHIEKFSDLKKSEFAELYDIIKVSEKALCEVFMPEWYNVHQSGNWEHHFHFLVLPRYKSTREFNGKVYEDKTFRHPITFTKQEEEYTIRKALTKVLSQHIE